MCNALLTLILLIFSGNFAAAQSGNDAPTIEQVEAQIKQFEQAAAEKAKQAEAARQAEINRQAQIKRDAAAVTEREQAAEQTETVEAGRKSVVQLSLPPPAPPERFERVTEGVKDNEQNLIWAERDNGSDINWNDATQYCSGLGSGWTLPSTVNLQSMYDASGKYPVPHVYSGTTYTVKPATPLIKFTGGGYWTNEQNGASGAWVVGLGSGSRVSYSVDYTDFTRALCVRRS